MPRRSIPLDLAAVKRDIAEVLTDSKDWWPLTSATTVRR